MKLLRFIIALLLISSVTACAYFNTFHNTKKLYNEARKERENRQGDKPSPTELRKYDETIEKASKVLELYPNSKYVDDSVFILGECFFYKGDYVKARRKFEELITYFADSKYFGLAKLWLAKTNIGMEEFFTARFILEELKDSEKIKRDIRDEAAILLGDIQFHQEAFEAAKEAYSVAAETVQKSGFRGRAFNQLGLAQLQTGEYFEAVESFQKALKDSPDKRFTLEAELNLARALKLSGDFKEASSLCRSLLQQEEFKDKHGQVKVEIADCLYREGKAIQQELKSAEVNYVGKLEKAIDEYKKITLEFKRTEVSAMAYYEIAKIYEEDFGDFVLAKQYYEKIKAEYRSSELVETANLKARDISELIRLKALVTKSQVRQLGTGSAYSGLSELEILLREHGVHPELRFMRKNRDRLAKASKAVNGTSQTNGAEAPNDLAEAPNDLDAFIASKLQLAETYLFQFGKIDSAIQEYNEVIELFPDHSGAAQALYTNAFIYENELRDKAKTDSLLYVLIERFPESEQAQEARKILGLIPKLDDNKVAFEMYKAAEQSLFTDKNPGQAISDFERVVEIYPNSKYAPKASYAIAWIHEKVLVDNEKARELYSQLLEDYPDSEYASNAQVKLDAFKQIAKESEQLKAAEADSVEVEAEPSPTPVTEDSLKLDKMIKKQIVTKASQEAAEMDSAASGEKNKPIP